MAKAADAPTIGMTNAYSLRTEMLQSTPTDRCKNIVQFGLGEKTTIYDDTALNFLRPLTFLSTQTLDVGPRCGGGVTHHGSITMSGFIQSIVDPTDLRDRTAAAEGIPGATLDETVAHELIGHAGAFLRGRWGHRTIKGL